MSKRITRHQFLTVWDEAVGKNGYNKSLFQEILNTLSQKGLIVEDSELETIPHDEIADLFLKEA